MRYGLPYKGSKNAIAEWIVTELPYSKCFVDLFCGGGAITHRALLSGKYKRFIMNDIDARLPILFKDVCLGKYTLENQKWVSREEFNRLKDTDAYIALIWSFGNNGIDYMYGYDIEDFKHALHNAVYENNADYLKPYGFNVKESKHTDIYKRYLDYNHQCKNLSEKEQYTRLQNLENMNGLENLQRLNRLCEMANLRGAADRIETYGIDYQNVPIPEGALIYCDIPYKSTNCGKYDGFNHDRFYEWAEKQDNIFISEYSMPDDFVKFAWKDKVVLSDKNGNSAVAREMIYTNKRTYEKLTDNQREIAKMNFAEQMTLF